MRIAIVCPYAWDRFGGVQSHVRALAAGLRDRGHQTDVIAPHSLRRAAVRAPGDAVLIGKAIPVPANGSVAPLAFGPLTAGGVRRALRTLRPEVVHIHEPLIPSLSLLALWNAKVPTVGTFHAAAGSSAGYRVARPALARAAERLTVRTAVSEAARALAARYFPGDYVITPNGVETRRFELAEPADLGAGLKVLFLGRIERRKGLEVLLQAATRLRDLEVTVVVAGSGPELPASRALARRLAVPARFLGAVHEDLKPGLFRAADVYCAPNLGGESFGIVLIEAMAAGTPVVCSDLPGFRAVAAGAAVLVEPDGAGELADALRAVLTDPARAAAMAAAGTDVALRYDWAQLAAEVEGVYEKALARA